MNEEQYEAPRRGSSKVIIIIMGLIIIALSGALVFLLLTGNEKKNNEKEGPENKPPKEYSINVAQIEFPQYACGGLDFKIGTGTYTVEEMTAKEKLGMVATEMLDKVEKDPKSKGDQIYDGMELDFDITYEVEKYFKIDSAMQKQIEEGFGTGFYVFYKKNDKSYVKLIIGGCIGPENEGYYIKFKENKQNENIYIKTYYYVYAVNDPEKLVGDDYVFTSSYYKLKGDKVPVAKNIESRDSLNYELFNTFDVYYDITDGTMKLIKVVYNNK